MPLRIERSTTIIGQSLGVDPVNPSRFAYCAPQAIQLTEDGGAAFGGPRAVLEYQRAGALTQHEPVPAGIERAGDPATEDVSKIECGDVVVDEAVDVGVVIG